MKKLLSILLVLSMLFAIGACFTSCDALSIEDVKNNPVNALWEAEKLAWERFANDDYGIEGVVTDTLKGGSIELAFAQEALLGAGTAIKATLYTGDKQAASLLYTEGGKSYTADIFSDENGIIVDIPDLLGGKAVGVFYNTLKEKLADSALAEMMELPPEAAAELVSMLDEYKATIEASMKDSIEDAEKTANEYLDLMKKEITEETVGDELCAVITLTLDNEVLGDVIEKAVNSLELSEEEKATLLAQFDINALNEMLSLDVTVKAYIALSDGRLVKFVYGGEMMPVSDKSARMAAPEEIGFDITLSFTDTAITASGTVTANGESATVSCNLNKTVEEEKSIYTLSASIGAEGVSETIDVLKYTFNKADKTFSLKTEIEGETVIVKGNVSSTKTTAKIAITEIRAGSIGVELDLSLTFNKDAKAPDAPTDALDVVELTAEEWQSLMTTVQESPLFALIESLLSENESDFIE